MVVERRWWLGLCTQQGQEGCRAYSMSWVHAYSSGCPDLSLACYCSLILLQVISVSLSLSLSLSISFSSLCFLACLHVANSAHSSVRYSRSCPHIQAHLLQSLHPSHFGSRCFVRSLFWLSLSLYLPGSFLLSLSEFDWVSSSKLSEWGAFSHLCRSVARVNICMRDIRTASTMCQLQQRAMTHERPCRCKVWS